MVARFSLSFVLASSLLLACTSEEPSEGMNRSLTSGGSSATGTTPNGGGSSVSGGPGSSTAMPNGTTVPANTTAPVDTAAPADTAVPDTTLPPGAECAPNAKRCQNLTAELCDANGQWALASECPDNCHEGECVAAANFPFPTRTESEYCTYPVAASSADVRAAYELWKETVVTAEGAGGFLRVRKPDSGTVIDSTVSEGIGYGMLLAVYMNDQELFDPLWKYAKLHFNANGFMNWEIGPDGNVTAAGSGAASDGDEDMAWALVMADKQWGGQGSLDDTYLNEAIALINNMLEHQVDVGRDYMLKPGDSWGDVDITNPSYFAPAYYRVFGKVTGREAEWQQVIDSSYEIINRSLNADSGNAENGLVPAWCDSQGTPVEAYAGAPTHFQNDSTRTPFRVAQDYCYYGEPRAKAYLDKINSFYTGVGVANIVDGYELDGTPRPERAADGVTAASFVGPAGVAAMADPAHSAFVNDAVAALATLQLTAGTIYYQKSWTALSLLMMSGNFTDWTAP